MNIQRFKSAFSQLLSVFYILLLVIFFVVTLYYDNEFDFLTEFILLNNIIIGFGYFLGKYENNKEKVFFNYLLFLISAFIVYIILSIIESFLLSGVNFNAFFLVDQASLQIKILIACFYIFFLVVLRVELFIVRFYNLELLFIFALLAWVSLLTCFSFNFIFLFLTMELLTILLVILMAIYFIFVGTKLLKPVTQFFVLNIVMSVFFLFCVFFFLSFNFVLYD